MSQVCNKIAWRPTANLQVAETFDRSTRELAGSVFSMLRCHEKTPRQVGRIYGLTDAEVWTLYEEADAEHERKIYQQGLRAGRLMNWPVTPMAA